MPKISPIERALAKVKGLPELKGKISNEDAFDILRRHFILGEEKEKIADEYEPFCGRSFVLRILSRKSGVDTSRLKEIRRIFKEYLEDMGQPDPFERYYSEKEKKKVKKLTDEGLGII